MFRQLGASKMKCIGGNYLNWIFLQEKLESLEGMFAEHSIYWKLWIEWTYWSKQFKQSNCSIWI
jgi:hypothetical protein